MKYWNSRWFYIRQHKQFVPCDVDQVPVSNKKWLARPNSNGMEQVREILTFLLKKLDGVCVAMDFIFRRVQPYKERVHPRYDLWGRPIAPVRCLSL